MPAKKSPAHFMKQAEQCYELALGNYSTRQIAEKLGISQTLVVRRLKMYQEQQITPKAEEYRNRQQARIEVGVKAIWSKYVQGDESAIRSMARLMDREAKLLGLDSATAFKVEVAQVPDELEVQRLVATFYGENPDAITEAPPRPSRPRTPHVSHAITNTNVQRATPDEFPDTFQPHEVQESEPEPVDEIEPPRPKRRRGKPIPNPAHQFLRDADDD